MNDDYLWDKSGEPDPQVQELEEILGALRYQPRPLELPKEVKLPQRRNYVPWMLIAASVLVALVAGGIWLRVRSGNEAPQFQAQTEPVPSPTTTPVEEKVSENKPAPREERIAVHKRKPAAPKFTKRESQEALLAKEQVMLALRLTSEKLHLVQRKTQGPMPANQIKNQHKAG